MLVSGDNLQYPQGCMMVMVLLLRVGSVHLLRVHISCYLRLHRLFTSIHAMQTAHSRSVTSQQALREIAPHGSLPIRRERLQHLIRVDSTLRDHRLCALSNFLGCLTLDHLRLECECDMMEDLLCFGKHSRILSMKLVSWSFSCRRGHTSLTDQ